MTAKTTIPLPHWSPICEVVPFPLVRRQELVERTARNVAFRGYALGSHDPAATGEKLLQAAIRQQRDTMERRGISQETIERELQQFEAAVRIAADRLLDDAGTVA